MVVFHPYQNIYFNIFSGKEIHKKFGGVVPELAARAHIEKIDWIVQEAINESGFKAEEIDSSIIYFRLKLAITTETKGNFSFIF